MTDFKYEPPKWAGKSPPGFHLDVSKDGKLFQKLMIDDKSYYLFGRNISLTDFCIDHSSCSRVHAALVYHKHLNRFFLTDLGSTHGSFIGNIRLESNKPTQLPIDSTFKFGASSRVYTLREKPKKPKSELSLDEDAAGNLPETECELDNLTEYNTAQNRRISMLGISADGDALKPATALKRKSVAFNEEEDVINPEDFDPNVGKFRNLVQSTIVVTSAASAHRNKKLKIGDNDDSMYSSLSFLPRLNPAPQPISSQPSASSGAHQPVAHFISARSLGTLPDPAPDPTTQSNFSDSSELCSPTIASSSFTAPQLYDDLTPLDQSDDSAASKKKKYAKEAWPGFHGSTASLANF